MFCRRAFFAPSAVEAFGCRAKKKYYGKTRKNFYRHWPVAGSGLWCTTSERVSKSLAAFRSQCLTPKRRRR